MRSTNVNMSDELKKKEKKKKKEHKLNFFFNSLLKKKKKMVELQNYLELIVLFMN